MKTIPMAHFESKYTIYENGTIMSHTRNMLIKPTQNPNGYMKYTFCLNGNKQQQLIHQVIALHFLPNPYGHKQVNHIDGDKTNNALNNLEWVSRKDNIQHSLKIGLRKGYMSAEDKETYLKRVLAGEQVKDIALTIQRRPETLHKMLRETAVRLGLSDKWKKQMQENRKNAAIRNLEKINSA